MQKNIITITTASHNNDLPPAVSSSVCCCCTAPWLGRSFPSAAGTAPPGRGGVFRAASAARPSNPTEEKRKKRLRHNIPTAKYHRRDRGEVKSLNKQNQEGGSKNPAKSKDKAWTRESSFIGISEGVPNLSLTMYPFGTSSDEHVPLKYLMTKTQNPLNF